MTNNPGYTRAAIRSETLRRKSLTFVALSEKQNLVEITNTGDFS